MGDVEDLCLFRQICNVIVTKGENKREDLGAFPVDIPNAVGLEECVFLFISYSLTLVFNCSN